MSLSRCDLGFAFFHEESRGDQEKSMLMFGKLTEGSQRGYPRGGPLLGPAPVNCTFHHVLSCFRDTRDVAIGSLQERVINLLSIME